MRAQRCRVNGGGVSGSASTGASGVNSQQQCKRTRSETYRPLPESTPVGIWSTAGVCTNRTVTIAQPTREPRVWLEFGEPLQSAERTVTLRPRATAHGAVSPTCMAGRELTFLSAPRTQPSPASLRLAAAAAATRAAARASSLGSAVAANASSSETDVCSDIFNFTRPFPPGLKMSSSPHCSGGDESSCRRSGVRRTSRNVPSWHTVN